MSLVRQVTDLTEEMTETGKIYQIKDSEMNLVNRTIIMNKEEATAIEGVADEEKEGEQVLDLPQKTKDKD